MLSDTMKHLETLPVFLTSSDLIKLGLFTTHGALYCARVKGRAPDYVQINRKILYPKESVVTWLVSHLKLGSTVKSVTVEASESCENVRCN